MKSHNENMPSEIRAWMNRPQRTPTLLPSDESPINRLRREFEESKKDFNEKHYYLEIQSKHIEWFAARSSLEDAAKQKQEQLAKFREQETTAAY